MDLLEAILVPLEGGHSGETFLAEAAGERSVVRIYAHTGARRGPDAADIDASVLRLVRGLLPVPEVREVRRADPAAGTPALLVTSYLPGERLELILPEASDDLRAAIGENLGRVLARLSGMPFLRPGMLVDADLRVGKMPDGAADLVEWVESKVVGTALEEWTAEECDRLRGVADEAQTLLDAEDRVCLVHSDFNPKNLLVDPVAGEVTGVLDWEFAHAGCTVSDLGNLLRWERDPVFADAVLGAYRERMPAAEVGPDLLDRARAADLWALIDLSSRRGENPVTERADVQLRAIARTGDLHALPD